MIVSKIITAVSIQDRRAANPLAGHQAAGLLLGPFSVMVPDFPDSLTEFDVLLSNPAQDGGRHVERLLPERVRVFRLEGGGASAHIELAAPSRYPVLDGSVSGCAWREAVRQADGLLWPALHQLDLVPRGFPDWVPGPEPIGMQPWVPPLRQEIVLKNPGGRFWPWCSLFPWCEPCGRPPHQPPHRPPAVPPGPGPAPRRRRRRSSRRLSGQ